MKLLGRGQPIVQGADPMASPGHTAWCCWGQTPLWRKRRHPARRRPEWPSGRVLTVLAAGADAEEFEGVEQQLKAVELLGLQLYVVHGADPQWQGAAAIDAGEVVLVAFSGGVERFATGQMAATHEPALLQLAKMPVDRGQTHAVGRTAQPGVQILAGELMAGGLQLIEQMALLRVEQALLQRALVL
jgi:hypothetical protein